MIQIRLMPKNSSGSSKGCWNSWRSGIHIPIRHIANTAAALPCRTQLPCAKRYRSLWIVSSGRSAQDPKAVSLYGTESCSQLCSSGTGRQRYQLRQAVRHSQRDQYRNLAGRLCRWVLPPVQRQRGSTAEGRRFPIVGSICRIMHGRCWFISQDGEEVLRQQGSQKSPQMNWQKRWEPSTTRSSV